MIATCCESGFQSWPQHSLSRLSWLKHTNHTSVSPFDFPHTSPSFMLTLWIWEEHPRTMCLWLMVSRGFSRMLGSREGLWADECSHSLASYLVLRRSQYTPNLQNGEASVVHACCCGLAFSSPSTREQNTMAMEPCSRHFLKDATAHSLCRNAPTLWTISTG